MPDPFATAITALHGSALAVAAVHYDVQGLATPCRVIRSQPTIDGDIGQARIPLDSNRFSMLRAEIAKPAKGDQLWIGDDIFVLTQPPRLDDEGMSWISAAKPA